MLQILCIEHLEHLKSIFPNEKSMGEILFEENPTFIFTIKAPIYWWVDTDWIKYNVNMPTSDFEFCFDEVNEDSILLITLKGVLNTGNWGDWPRTLMQILPMATIVRGVIEMSYREIIEVCENYVAGEYNYQSGYSFPNDREWADFCETLLDLKGVRDLVEEEI